MNKLTVKLTQKSKAFPTQKTVFAATVQLQAGATGTSAITAADQQASIEIFEESDKSNPILTISTMNLKEVGGKPEFSIDSASTSSGTNAGATDTDFTIRLEFDPATFKNVSNTTFTLRIPFDRLKSVAITASGTTETATVRAFRVSAQVKIAGNVEGAAFAAGADVLDIPALHKTIADLDDATLKVDAVGVGTMYPLGLFADFGGKTPPLLKPGETIAKQALEIVLTDTVGPVFNQMVASSLDTSKLQTNLATIFKNVFPSVTVRTATTQEMALWQRVFGAAGSGKLWSAKITNVPSFQTGDGVELPFFQFFVDANNSASSNGEELADASAYDDASLRVNRSTGKKKLINPINVPCALGSKFNVTYKKLASTDERMAMFANVLAHEIGHDLGLRHAFHFDDTSFVDGQGVGLMHSLFVAATPLPLRQLGPVHDALLKKHYP